MISLMWGVIFYSTGFSRTLLKALMIYAIFIRINFGFENYYRLGKLWRPVEDLTMVGNCLLGQVFKGEIGNC